MDWFTGFDWRAVFVPSTPVPETLVRGTVMYVGLVLLMRLIHRRQIGTLSVTDLLVIVLIAEAAQGGIAGRSEAVPDALILVATILFWSYALDWLGYRVPWVGRVVHPPPLELVRDGRMMRRNMRAELVTPDELMSQLREQGVENLADVKAAYMEGDGRISIIRREGGDDARRQPEARA